MERNFDREEFMKLNFAYDAQHGITEGDIAKAIELTSMIELNHKIRRTPQVGDLVEGAYYDGKYPYRFGLIEKVHDDGTVSICYQPYVPFVYFDTMLDLHLSVSGGPFGHHKLSELELVEEEDRRTFCDWGMSGACANGAIHFKAPVRRWRIPYVRQSRAYLYFIKNAELCSDDRYATGNCYIDGGMDSGFRKSFVSMDAFEKYAANLGISYKKEYECESIIRYHLSHDFKTRYFRSMEELPDGVKPIKGWSNGSMCTCYFRTLEHDVEYYHPNPNYKDVYDVIPYEEAIRVKEENGWL